LQFLRMLKVVSIFSHSDLYPKQHRLLHLLMKKYLPKILGECTKFHGPLQDTPVHTIYT
jgi:hypothetical protein